MKKNKTTLVITLLLAGVAAVLIYTSTRSTIKKELKDFAIEDTASVTKIFLADKSGKQILLEKITAGNWKLNGKFIARNDAISTLLITMKKLEVRSPVAKAAYENVIKNLATTATKVEIYQNDELVKTYYVGGATQDQLGTFMLLENSTTPFVMYLPGLNGYLTARYFTDETEWKSRMVFNYAPSEIGSVTVEYPKAPKLSMNLMVKENDSYAVSSLTDKKTLQEIDTNAVSRYLASFREIQYEAVITNIDKTKQDSTISSTPVSIITVVDKKGNKNSIKIFLKPITESSLVATDDNGKPLQYDIDRMYGIVNDGKDFLLIQHFVFDKLLRTSDDFKVKKDKKPNS